MLNETHQVQESIQAVAGVQDLYVQVPQHLHLRRSRLRWLQFASLDAPNRWGYAHTASCPCDSIACARS